MIILSKIKNKYKKIKHYNKMRRSPSYNLGYRVKWGTTEYLTDDEKAKILSYCEKAMEKAMKEGKKYKVVD